MLSPAPCFKYLIGCSEADILDSDNGYFVDETGSSDSGTHTTNSSYIFSSRSSSFSSSAANFSAFSSCSSSQATEVLAHRGDINMLINSGAEVKSMESYKPVSYTLVPETGVSDYLFASLLNDDFVRIPRSNDSQTAVEQFWILPIFVLSCISLLLIGFIRTGRFSQK